MSYNKVLIPLLFLTGCGSYQPSIENYQEKLQAYLGHHEDSVLTDFGRPDEIVELSNGTRALVYRALPYKISPVTKNAALDCRTVFRVGGTGVIHYYAAEGTFCVR